MACFHCPAERRGVRGGKFLKMTYRMAGYVRIVATVLEIAPTKKAWKADKRIGEGISTCPLSTTAALTLGWSRCSFNCSKTVYCTTQRQNWQWEMANENTETKCFFPDIEQLCSIQNKHINWKALSKPRMYTEKLISSCKRGLKQIHNSAKPQTQARY